MAPPSHVHLTLPELVQPRWRSQTKLKRMAALASLCRHERALPRALLAWSALVSWLVPQVLVGKGCYGENHGGDRRRLRTARHHLRRRASLSCGGADCPRDGHRAALLRRVRAMARRAGLSGRDVRLPRHRALASAPVPAILARLRGRRDDLGPARLRGDDRLRGRACGRQALAVDRPQSWRAPSGAGTQPPAGRRHADGSVRQRLLARELDPAEVHRLVAVVPAGAGHAAAVRLLPGSPPAQGGRSARRSDAAVAAVVPAPRLPGGVRG